MVRRFPWFALVIAALAVIRAAPADGLRAADAADADLYATGGTIEEDMDVQRQMRRAENFADAGNYDRACEVIQAIAESEKGGTAVVAVGERLFLNARERCHRLVASLPPSGLDVYRLRVDAAARRLYEASIETLDEAGLRRVADLYLCSSWGDDALNRLGDLLLDRGDLRGAAAAWGRLLAGCPPERGRSLAGALAKYAAVSSLLERRDEVDVALRRLEAEHGEARLQLGGLTVAVADLGPDRLPARATDVERPADGAWRLPEGLRRRWGKTPRAFRPSAAAKAQHGAIAGQRRFLVLPTATAAVIDDVVVTKDFNRVHAWDLRRTDRPLWLNAGENPEADRAGTIASHPNNWQQLHAVVYPALHANYLDRGAQSIGVGEGLVVVTERNAYPFDATTGWNPQAPLSRTRNEVVAYASRTGKRRWELPAGESRLDGVRFINAPTIDDGQAIFPVVKGDQLAVLCVGVERGELRWLTPIASHPLGGALRAWRDDASAVAVDGTTAYVVTNTGFAAAVDRLDGSIRWIARLPRKFSTPAPNWNVDARGDCLMTSDPVVVDGRLVVAPSDSDHVICLDAGTGAEIWKAAVPNTVTHLIGVRGGRVVLGGREIYAFDLDAPGPRPDPVWRASADPVGRGCLDDRHVYVPCTNGIARFRLADGVALEAVDLGPDDSPLGNLVPFPGGLVVVDEAGLAVYSSFSHDFAALSARIDANALDTRSLLARAQLCASEGDEANVTRALADLERARAVFASGDVEPTEAHAAEVRALSIDLYLDTGTREAVEKASALAETASERTLVALALAEVDVAAGEPVSAARALQTALAAADGVKVEADGAIESAPRRLRRRLLALAADPTHGPAVRAHFDASAGAAGISGRDLADRYPAAGGAPDTLLAAAEAALARRPEEAYDLAERLIRDYSWSAAVERARDVRGRSMSDRGLDPVPPRRVGPGIGFPLREIRSEEATGGALQGKTPTLVRFADGLTAGDAGHVFFFLRSSDLGGEYVRCRDVTTGATLWRGYANFGDAVPEKVVAGEEFLDRRFAGGISGDTVCIGTIHGFSAFELGEGSFGGRIVWQAPYGPGLRKLAAEAAGKPAGNVRIRRGFIAAAVASDPPDVPRPVIAHGVAAVVHEGRATAYRVDVRGRDEGEQLWSFDESGTLVGDPVIVGDRLVATFHSPFQVHVRRLNDGALEPRLPIGPGDPAGPAIVGPDGGLFVATDLGQLRRYDLATGVEDWSTHVDARLARIVHVDGKRVVVETEDGAGIALDATTGQRLWREPLAAPNAREGTIAVVGDADRLYAWSGVVADAPAAQQVGGYATFGVYSTSRVRGIDLATGKALWTSDVEGSVHVAGQLVAADGAVLIAWSAQGRTVLLGLDGVKGDEKTKDSVKHDQPWCRPDVTATAGTVLLATGDGVRIYRSTTRGDAK